MKIETDLTNHFVPIRDQGSRQTCLSCSVSDAHAAMLKTQEPLSVEYLYYFAQLTKGLSDADGSCPYATLHALNSKGQPKEVIWPYNPKSTPHPWEPPKNRFEVFKMPGEVSIGSTSDVQSHIANGQPVVLLMELSDGFYNVNTSGIIDHEETDPPDPARRHAVIGIATGRDALGDCAILIRNSWGTDWGIHGCAWLTEHFLNPRLVGYLLLQEST